MKNDMFKSTFCYKLIYIFRINDEAHKGKLKIGEATVHTDKKYSDLENNCEELMEAAKDRINSYTSTAGTTYELLHTEIAVTNEIKPFNDHKVHSVLIRSGIERFFFDTEKKQNEWFVTDLSTAKLAIKAVKEGKEALNTNQITNHKNPIIFRPEQEKAIKQTIDNFKKSDTMLWNAKMRFGKTLSALEVVKREGFERTIIITHRPVVNDGWYEDFSKIFFEDDNRYKYGSKTKGESIENLLRSKKPFVYFASIQDLRGASQVGGKFEKDELIFNTKWDMVVIDEAHEGTRTGLGERTIEGVVKLNDDYITKVLMLSGTPFNLLNEFKEDEIYTWDYIMEQSAKLEWDKEHYGDSNPYADLPQMNIYTYYLDKMLPAYLDVSDNAFNFREFFRTWSGEIEIDRKPIPNSKTVGDFVHEEDIKKFLDLLCKEDEKSNYPYSTEKYRDYFRHSLWMVPGVKEAKALSKMLKQHGVFGSGVFNIVNVAGNGDEEEKTEEALRKVRSAITNKPEETYTITLSCGRLTTGVSVPEWTAVFMLAGSYSTAASNYLQTIFRVQTPAKIGGKVKDKCYVFDFAPDRTLKMAAQAGQLSIKPGSTQSKTIMGEFLNFCPIIGINGSQMVNYDVTEMLRQLKKAVAQRVVTNGFDDRNIYNDNLLQLDDIDLKEFDELKKIIGASKQTKRIDNIDINDQGFTEEQYKELEKIKKKPRRELTEEEKKKLEELKEKKKQASTAISILRGISIRIPLLIYGADIEKNKDIDTNNFVNIVDDKSWKEFMPNGITKDIFNKFAKYYDNEVFIEAGRQIRKNAEYADTLPIKERIQKLAEIFSMFRNPDKETVLTPWKTVNMHLADCIGGYNFNYPDSEPRYINQGEVTDELFNNPKVKILEINSKTGLYALYCAYSIYMNKLINYNKRDYTEEKNKDFWNSILRDNLFIICKTKMAKQIVNRTLVGYNKSNTNILVMENIIDELNDNEENVISFIKNNKTWGRSDEMKFNAVVGNPPYQENVGDVESNASLSKQLYPSFIKASIELKPKYVSLITPSRWFSGNGQDGSFPKLREFIKDNNHMKKIVNFPNAKNVFSNVNIAGGVNYFLYDNTHNDNVDFIEVDENNNRESSIRPLFEEGNDIILPMNRMIHYINKVRSHSDFKPLSSWATGRNAFGVVGKNINNISSDSYFDNAIELRCAHEEIRYIDEKYITNRKDVMNNWKIFISKANGGAGLLTDTGMVSILGKAYIGKPRSACTDTLIPIGSFKTEAEAINLQKYMSTKFLRFMVGILKVSQNLYQGLYQYVPIQNFKNNSDINWNDSIEKIDKQLYAKYNFSDEEIDYIESKIKYI